MLQLSRTRLRICLWARRPADVRCFAQHGCVCICGPLATCRSNPMSRASSVRFCDIRARRIHASCECAGSEPQHSNLVPCRLGSAFDHYKPKGYIARTLTKFVNQTALLPERGSSSKHGPTVHVLLHLWFVTDRAAGSLLRWRRCVRHRHRVPPKRIRGR